LSSHEFKDLPVLHPTCTGSPGEGEEYRGRKVKEGGSREQVMGV